jgi:hypothetical protein
VPFSTSIGQHAPQCAVLIHRAAFGPPPARAARLQDIDLMRISQGYRNDFCNRLAVGEMTGDLKQLMADVTQAMEKAQEAVARIASKPAAETTETESTSR